MKKEIITISDLRMSFQIALLGEVYPAIRQVAFKHDPVRKILLAHYYLDREPREQDYAEASAVMSEVAGNYSMYAFHEELEECFFSEKPMHELDPLSGIVYARRELCTSSVVHASPPKKKIVDRDLSVDLQKALLYEIYPAIRGIAFKYESAERRFTIRCYVDRNPREEDSQMIRSVMGKVTQNYETSLFKEKIEECIYSNEPGNKLDSLGGLVYARKEYDLEGLV